MYIVTAEFPTKPHKSYIIYFKIRYTNFSFHRKKNDIKRTKIFNLLSLFINLYMP